MKFKTYIIIITLTLSAAMSGCKKDFLDRQLGTLLSDEEVFSSYANTERFLIGTYAWLPGGFERIDGAMLDAATDDAEHTWDGSAIQRFNNGSWSPFSNPEDQWNYFFTGIRKTNLFLENADKVNLDAYRLDPANQTEYKNRLGDITRWKAEARFMRAYFYFELVKRYGAVPLLTSTLSLDDDLAGIKRNTLDECMSFIVSECDEAAKGLNIFPGRAANDGNATGRVTKGAALALKSRTLLYAASPLYLQPDNLTGTKPADAAKWEKAAAAAKAVIDLGPGTYTLLGTYSGLYNSIKNSELILAKRYGASNSFERANYSVGYDQGQSGTTPSQNLVDAYEMKTGKLITDPSSDYNPQDPYANRDPRLTQTIIVNNSTWKSRIVECWTGGKDGKGVDRASKTGYYLKKNVAEGVNLITNTTQIHAWPLFRLAEMYLNYAEALNEYSPGNSDIAKYINMIRRRAGIADLPSGLSQDAMRERIHNERRIELAFEEHRFWDVRRWKEGVQYFGAPLKGVEITKTGNVFTYVPFTVESRVFEPKMYWYPIPQTELIKSHGWQQNTGW